MHFTSKQIQRSTTTVDLFHSRFILQQAGVDALTPAERKALQAAGEDLTKYKGKRTPVDEAYLFGKWEQKARKTKGFNRLDLKGFRKLLDENQELFKLTSEDRKALKLAKQAFANDIRRLAGDIKSDLHQSLIDVSKTATTKKQALKQVAAKFAENTKRYDGRIQLISGYRMHETFQSGIVQQILQQKGENARVYFSVHPDACHICKKLFLKKDGQPKIFLLKTLLANGTNIGIPNNKKRPTCGPIHPNCRCKLNTLPAGRVKWSLKQRHYIKMI